MLATDVSDDLRFFDRFAAWCSVQVARAPFFIGCLALIICWPVTFFIFDADTAQLLVNTATTIVTFLLVALLQNSQHRGEQALQHKLNSIADALADLMDELDMDEDAEQLQAAVGLEDRESSS